MQRLLMFAATLTLVLTAPVQAGSLRGQYLEARTCDVYTGPCFANAEWGLAGREAVMAWRVDEGSWQGTPLDGLCVAVVLKAEDTLATDGIFPTPAEQIRSVILVDEQADDPQRKALEGFARQSASQFTVNVDHVAAVPMELSADHDAGRAHFTAGKLAEIRTREINKLDCVCTNEMVYYEPLAPVKFASPVFSLSQSYRGDGLGGRWTLNSTRSAFLGAFRN